MKWALPACLLAASIAAASTANADSIPLTWWAGTVTVKVHSTMGGTTGTGEENIQATFRLRSTVRAPHGQPNTYMTGFGFVSVDAHYHVTEPQSHADTTAAVTASGPVKLVDKPAHDTEIPAFSVQNGAWSARFETQSMWAAAWGRTVLPAKATMTRLVPCDEGAARPTSTESFDNGAWHLDACDGTSRSDNLTDSVSAFPGLVLRQAWCRGGMSNEMSYCSPVPGWTFKATTMKGTRTLHVAGADYGIADSILVREHRKGLWTKVSPFTATDDVPWTATTVTVTWSLHRVR